MTQHDVIDTPMWPARYQIVRRGYPVDNATCNFFLDYDDAITAAARRTLHAEKLERERPLCETLQETRRQLKFVPAS